MVQKRYKIVPHQAWRGSMNKRQRRAKREEQSELFEGLKARRPEWADLSREAQGAVTELFARMLRQHRHEKQARPADEVGHE